MYLVSKGVGAVVQYPAFSFITGEEDETNNSGEDETNNSGLVWAYASIGAVIFAVLLLFLCIAGVILLSKQRRWQTHSTCQNDIRF